MLSSPGTLIVLIKSKVEALQPLDLLVAVVLGPFGTNHVLDDDAAIFVKLISPIAVVTVAEVNQVLHCVGLVGRFGDLLNDSGC